MSEDEKNAQIGAAVSEYQAAKVDLAHVEKKISNVFTAYRQAAATMDSSHGTIAEPRLENGKVVFGWNKEIVASDILNVRELAPLLEERDKARARLAKAQKGLADLGLA